MESTRFDRLTKRHRECLRGVRELKGSKEIAEELGIEKSTVDSYLTEAVKVLGARNRRDAALQLDAHERDSAASFATAAASTTPDKIGGDSPRLAGAADPLPVMATPGDRQAVGKSQDRLTPPGSDCPFGGRGKRGTISLSVTG